MKVTKKTPALKLHRETLRILSQLQQVVGGLTHPYCASVPPLVCDTTTLHTDCC
jgi:hypothetical protein